VNENVFDASSKTPRWAKSSSLSVPKATYPEEGSSVARPKARRPSSLQSGGEHASAAR
jgi:hypothetical protein